MNHVWVHVWPVVEIDESGLAALGDKIRAAHRRRRHRGGARPGPGGRPGRRPGPGGRALRRPARARAWCPRSRSRRPSRSQPLDDYAPEGAARPPPRHGLPVRADRRARRPGRHASSSTTSTTPARWCRSTGRTGRNTAGIVAGVVTTPTAALPRGRHPGRAARRPDEGAGRASPSRSARASSPRSTWPSGCGCRWSGSRCPPAPGSRWTPAPRTWTGSRAALRRIVEFTQDGGEINVVVAGHQRRRPAVLERRGDDAHAHQGHPGDDAGQRDGAHRQAVAGLLRRRVGRGQLRHRRLRPGDGPERPGPVLGAEPRRRLRRPVRALRPHVRRARRARPAPRRAPPTRSTATSATYPHDVPDSDFTHGRRDLLRRDQPGPQEAVRHPHGDAGAWPTRTTRRWSAGPGMADADTAVVLDAHLGGIPVCLLGIESRPVPRRGFPPTDGPDTYTAGTLFPRSSKKAARAINAASGNRPLVVLANLSGLRRLAGVDAQPAAGVRRRDRPGDRQLRRPDRVLRDLALPRRRVRGVLQGAQPEHDRAGASRARSPRCIGGAPGRRRGVRRRGRRRAPRPTRGCASSRPASRAADRRRAGRAARRAGRAAGRGPGGEARRGGRRVRRRSTTSSAPSRSARSTRSSRPRGCVRRSSVSSSGSRESRPQHDEAARLPALPADVRAEPHPPAGPAHRAPRRRDRLGQARGLQLGTRVRRQQDPQARVPRPRRAGPGRRHAGLDRRRTSPTTPARSPPSPRKLGPEVPCWCRRSWVDWPDAGQRPGRQHPARRASWAPTCGSTRPASTSASADSWEDALRRGRGAPAARRTRSRPARPTTRSAGSASPTGRTRWPSRRRELGVFFDTIVVCTVTGSTHAGHDRRLRRAAGAGGRPRRVIGIDASRDAGRRPATRSPGSPGTPPSSSASAATCATTRSPSSRAGPATSTASPSQSTLDAIRLTGALEGMIIDPVYEGKSMAGLIDLVSARRDPAGLHRPLRPPRRPAGAQRLLRHLRLRTVRPMSSIGRTGPPC